MDKKGKQMSRNSVSPSWFSPEPAQNTGKHLALQRLQITLLVVSSQTQPPLCACQPAVRSGQIRFLRKDFNCTVVSALCKHIGSRYSSSMEMLLQCWPSVVCMMFSLLRASQAWGWGMAWTFPVWGHVCQDATLALCLFVVSEYTQQKCFLFTQLTRYLWIIFKWTQKFKLWNHIRSRYRAASRSPLQPQLRPLQPLGQDSVILKSPRQWSAFQYRC